MRGLLRAGWLTLGADIAYWLWMTGHYDDRHLSSWHAWLDVFAFYGGWILLLVLLTFSYLAWRLAQADRVTDSRR